MKTSRFSDSQIIAILKHFLITDGPPEPQAGRLLLPALPRPPQTIRTFPTTEVQF